MNSSMFEKPWRYEFAQIVRQLLQEHIAQIDKPLASEDLQDLLQKQFRFSSTTNLGFPAAEVQSVQQLHDHHTVSIAHLQVNFLGLIGPSSSLPIPYSELLLSWQKQRDHIAVKFFDLFHQRMLCWFFAAQTKYNLCDLALRRDPALLSTFSALAATPASEKPNVRQHDLWFFAGALRQRPLPASSLVQLLASLFKIKVTFKPLQGEWLEIPNNCQGRVNDQGLPLDGSVALGAHFWDPQARIVLRIDDLDSAQLQRLMPGSAEHTMVVAMINECLAPDIVCDLELHLKCNQTPPTQLNATSSGNDGRLGWSSKIGSTNPVAKPFQVRLKRPLFH